MLVMNDALFTFFFSSSRRRHTRSLCDWSSDVCSSDLLFFIVYTYTRRVKKASREVRKQESKLVSVVEEVVTSIRVVKAFAREEYEIRRFEGESLDAVEAALKARALKAKLVPLVNIITAVGTCAVLWFGAHMAMSGRLLP